MSFELLIVVFILGATILLAVVLSRSMKRGTAELSNAAQTVPTDIVQAQQSLREGLFLLAQPPDEQIRLNEPGCVVCDLLSDYDLGCVSIREVGLPGATQAERDRQAYCLSCIDDAIEALDEKDLNCWDGAVLQRPRWQNLRSLASTALGVFGWENTRMEPYKETSAGVWRRPNAGPLHPGR